jgi:AcrR family transcriptional regulator
MTRATVGQPMTSTAAIPAGPRQQMDRGAWVEKSLEILASAGVAAIRVEVLARELDVTKGSFYWHFRDRAALLTATIAEWRNRTTTNVVQHLWGEPQDARTKLRRLWHICFSGRVDNPGGRLEVAIRQWALHDSAVAAIVAQNDAERIVFVEELYGELGAADPAGMARLYYFHILGRNFASQTSALRDPRTDSTVRRALLLDD